jgi:C1A family cysteine protease
MGGFPDLPADHPDQPLSTPVQARPKHVYGWRPSLPGVRLPHADTSGLKILPEVDPRKQMPPVFDQGQLGSCTANATAACFQYDSILNGKDCGELARLWIYYFERAIEGSLGQGDTGAMGHDAFTVAKHGIPDETAWPYDIRKFEVKPPASFPRAYTLKKPVHAPAQSQTAVKQVLSNKQTIAFGFSVPESFEAQWDQPGVMPMPQPGEQILGGHEILAVGYLASESGYVMCRNSWGGPNAGLDVTGYFLMPWAFFLDQNQVQDLRTIVRPA